MLSTFSLPWAFENTHRQAHTHTCTERERDRERETDRQTQTQTDRQTQTQTDIQTDRHKEQKRITKKIECLETVLSKIGIRTIQMKHPRT